MSAVRQDAPVNRTKVGAKLRLARLRRSLRQADVALAAGISRNTVSKAELGQLGRLSVDVIDRLTDALGVWLELDVRSRDSDLDRGLNARHALLGERVMAWIVGRPGWSAVPEVSFAIGRESGVIDILAFHVPSGQLAIIELKTGIYDVDEILGTLDRKERLAGSVARRQGWVVRGTSVWLIVAESSTNRRRIAAHRTLVGSRLPAHGHAFRRWFRSPSGGVRGVAFWSNDLVGRVTGEIAARERVRRAGGRVARRAPRSARDPTMPVASPPRP